MMGLKQTKEREPVFTFSITGKNMSKNFLPLLIAMVGLCTTAAAQDLTEMTLDFNNVTATNVNQTIGELNNNEKEVEFGDYDNDGDMDVLLAVGQSDFGQRRNKLYRNDNGVLNEVSGAPVISGFSNTDTSRSAFFRDYNDDGLLDIIIINDSNSGTGGIDAPGRTKLYLQNGSGQFINSTNNLANQTGAACNGVSADFDGNGLPDLMMCNYPGISQDSLGFNGINGNAAGQFQVVTGTMYPAEQEYGVHAEAADMNGDGKIDFLTANWTDDNSFIYYNNNQNAGSGDGDFRYGGAGASSLFPRSSGSDERALVPADLNNDGMMDMYYANSGAAGAARADVLYINTGNDANNRATFNVTEQMPAAQNNETHKVTCEDLDGDGWQDIIVMSLNRRPFIYRNVSTTNDIKFVEWTPSNITVALDGWHAAAADVSGNGRPDVLFGANSNDHLFENVATSVGDFDSLNGVLPAFHNQGPIAFSGTVEGGETLTMVASGLPSGAQVSVIVRSEADLGLNVVRNGNSIGASDRAGEGVSEGSQVTLSGTGDVTFELTNNSAGVTLGDVNGDGEFNLLDVAPFVDLLANGGFNAAGDFNGDGNVNLLDVSLFVDGLATGAGNGSNEFVIEFLSR